jgi:hypothetical protein
MHANTGANYSLFVHGLLLPQLKGLFLTAVTGATILHFVPPLLGSPNSSVYTTFRVTGSPGDPHND